MAVTIHTYRGLEIYPIVYPRRPTQPGRAHNYDDGFNAAVRIQAAEGLREKPRSRVFGLTVTTPFLNSGDARRASIAYAERLIDGCATATAVLDMPV